MLYQYVFGVAGYLKRINETPTLIKSYVGLIDVVL